MDSSTTPFFRDEELREEDVLGLELQAWGLFTLIDLADQFVGAERVDEAIRPWGIDLRKLVKKRAWVTFDFAERVMDKLVQITGPELIARAGAASVSPRYLGPIYPLVRTFGNTASTFERILGSSPRYNKARDISLVWESEQRGRVRVALKPEIGPPKTRYFCEFAGAQLEAIPVLFGLPHARVIQTRCACDGNDACEFDIEWFPGKKRMPLWPVPIAFGTAGVALANALGGGVPIAAALGTACAVASLASAVVFRQQQELSSRLEDIDEHRSALSRSVRENELRFAEIVEAKSEVEDRVEERTRELGVATKQLQQTLDELQAMDQAKSDFFANVSHELRTPLTLIVSPLESLQRGSLSNDGRRIALETIENNARRLLRLINQLLDLAKVDARQATVSLSAVDLSQFVRDVVKGYSRAAEERGIDLRFEPRCNAILQLDPGWMESAVGNLLANAMRFAKSRVSVSAVDLGGDICIEVADDGPGIPPDEAARIFERFSQAGTDESRRKGTGLGLAIVREAARLHGGTVDVGESEHGGALFMVRIPRLLADGPASAFQAGAPAIEADRNAAMDDVPGPHPAAPVALVAEDHPELRGFIGEVLATQFRVLVTDRGDTALERAVREQPDVIVADISMPGMDGLELCRALRQTEEARDTPILLVTARGEPQQVLQGFDAGANDYLVKPFHGRELLARIDAQLRLRSMVHRLAHQERLASLGVLAASVAHQVRNPLTALVSGLPAVKRKIGGTLDDRTKEMMDVFVDCAHRIERITLDLLDLSRVDREEEGDLNPGAGLMAAVRLTTAQLPDDVEIHTEVDETTQIRGRAGDLNHVFLNLLDNAARAVGRRGRVSIHGLREDGIYRVTVEDSGNGVPEDIADRIFEPFVTSRPGGEGTGLGLAIVHDIVVAHRGEISVDRSPSLGGARFTITLPVSGEESVAAE